jgi:hypothetical protein
MKAKLLQRIRSIQIVCKIFTSGFIPNEPVICICRSGNGCRGPRSFWTAMFFKFQWISIQKIILILPSLFMPESRHRPI